MLIDYLEEAAALLSEKKDSYHKLNRQYKKFYSKDLREEMDLLKAEINKKNREVNEKLYDNLHELESIKNYFPDLYNVFLDDPNIGSLIKKKTWLLERKEEKKQKAEVKIIEIKEKRAQLRDAVSFIKKWPRETIDAKSLIATWSALKNEIKGEMDKDDVLIKIKDLDKLLKREGWLVLINESMVDQPLNSFSQKIKELKYDEVEKTRGIEEAKGKGSVKEYAALKEYRTSQKKRKRMERIIRHLLLASSSFLEKLKKRKKGNIPNDIEAIANSIKIKKINEKVWLKEMRKKLET
jgi:hypothetical protein